MLSESDRAAIISGVIKHFEANPPSPPPAPRKWFTTPEAAHYLRMTAGGLVTLRHNGEGPLYHRPTWRFLRYSLAALDRWLEDHPERRDGANPRRKGDPTPGPRGDA